MIIGLVNLALGEPVLSDDSVQFCLLPGCKVWVDCLFGRQFEDLVLSHLFLAVFHLQFKSFVGLLEVLQFEVIFSIELVTKAAEAV